MNNNRYQITKQWIDKFKKEIDDIAWLLHTGHDKEYIHIQVNSLSSQLYDLQEELKAMENEDNG